MSRQHAFTMVELLVSTAIGISLLTVATSAFVYMRRMVQRNAALLGLHSEAVSVQRTLADALLASHPGALWRLEASPGPDGNWGTGDAGETIALTWLCAVANPEGRTNLLGRDWAHDLVWARLEWRAIGPNGIPCLLFARSDGFRPADWTFTSGGSATRCAIRIYPQPRRDRRRDLDDNDLRHLPGMTPAVYAALALPGDGADLRRQLQPLTSPGCRITGLAIGWYDVRGHWTGIDTRRSPEAGIGERAADGSAVPLLATAWSNAQAVVLDGVRLDGTQTMVGADTVGSGDRRPTVVTLSFTCSDAATSGERTLEAPFAFSFPITPILGPL